MRLGAKQVITRKVEAPEQNARLRTCFDVAVEDLALLFPGEKELCHYGEYRTKLQILGIYDAFPHAITTGEFYRILFGQRLIPPPPNAATSSPCPNGSPVNPSPSNWLPHIYLPKEVAKEG